MQAKGSEFQLVLTRDLQEKSLHSIVTHPEVHDEHELPDLFPSVVAKDATTWLAPSPKELQQYRSQPAPRLARCPLPKVSVGCTKKPTILINLRLLVDTELWAPATCSTQIRAMPGFHHIYSLRPTLGWACSVTGMKFLLVQRHVA